MPSSKPLIALFEPKIPQNTGNIVRTCAAVGADLALIEPLGFRFSSRLLKRAGLDYFKHVDIERLADMDELLAKNRPTYFFSAHGAKRFDTLPFSTDDIYVFGSETDGLPDSIPNSERYYLPQKEEVRCINLSNAVAVVLYTAWRELGFKIEHHA